MFSDSVNSHVIKQYSVTVALGMALVLKGNITMDPGVLTVVWGLLSATVFGNMY